MSPRCFSPACTIVYENNLWERSKGFSTYAIRKPCARPADCTSLASHSTLCISMTVHSSMRFRLPPNDYIAHRDSSVYNITVLAEVGFATKPEEDISTRALTATAASCIRDERCNESALSYISNVQARVSISMILSTRAALFNYL